jgi:flavin-dependent dehydrogenase
MVQNTSNNYDVAIVGGGPAGSTTGALLKKYSPELRVVIFERELFPRDHVGESLLPPVSPILIEMGCWDKVENANFPIKIGATLRWGKNRELWDFEFFPSDSFVEQTRPAPFEGQRRLTSFQVDRAIYDEILLNHAAELGCEVLQGVKVTRIEHDANTVHRLELDNGNIAKARYYIDASGNAGIIRKALGVACEYPSSLQNIAIWDYWENADWAIKIGVGATRIQVRSLGYGWLWFIPVGPTRTSVGLILPADYFKKINKRPHQVYCEAISEEKEITALLRRATQEGKLQTTKDWSFLAERQAGQNWFLVGESGGFADPILSAGVTMAQVGAMQAACTILESDRTPSDAAWLRDQFEHRQIRRIRTHIKFADYWYTTNAQFKDLKEFTSELAKSNGLNLTPEDAWSWLAQGGFIDEDLSVGAGGFNLLSVRSSSDFLTELAADSPLDTSNVLTLDVNGAVLRESAAYGQGRVMKMSCYVRNDKVLPLWGHIGVLVQLLQQESRLPTIVQMMDRMAKEHSADPQAMTFLSMLPETMEGMIRDGWIRPTYDRRLPLVRLLQNQTGFHLNKDMPSRA